MLKTEETLLLSNLPREPLTAAAAHFKGNWEKRLAPLFSLAFNGPNSSEI